MKVKIKEKKTFIFDSIGIVIIAILIFFIFLAILLIGKLFLKSNVENDIIYSYNINNNLDYKVYLYKNDFISSEYLDMKKMYIADLIDYVRISFIYNYSGSKNVTMDYNYSVVATIYGEYQTEIEAANTVVWTKEYSIVNNTKENVTDQSQFNLKKDVDINYNYFNSEVTRFSNEFKIPINTYLNVKFKVDLKSIIEKKEINEDSVIEVNIPLNKQAFEITDKYVTDQQKSINNELPIQDGFNYIALIFYIILIVGSLISIVILLKKVIKIKIKTEYTKKLNKILKSYGDVIVNTLNPIKIKNLNVIDVKKFEEMLDLVEEIRAPILFNEVKEDNECWFVVIQYDIMYRYILKDEKENK
ncbi:MAG: DUF5305 family protein [Clostridia bacterium]|nr:DUF5305 family protein [Clostridia bacterium]MDD4387222.1 DUF5305 family protein [Clostridia bacterium]